MRATGATMLKRTLVTLRLGGAVLCAAMFNVVGWAPQEAAAQGWMPPPAEQRCPSQWGADDERGAANLQTPQAVLKAAKLIREGKVYELGKLLDATMPRSPGRTFAMEVKRTGGPNGRNQQRGNEETVYTELGQMGTQFDGLAHQGLGPHLYNCIENDKVATRGGFSKLGVEKVGSLFTRGVLLDVAQLKGVDILPDDYEIGVADLESAMRRQEVDFGAGDAVLIRTGWGRLYAVDNARFMKGEPGIGVAAAEFLARRNVMMVGSDNWAVEVRPNPDPGLMLPVHGFMLTVNGIFLVENLDLEGLSRDKVSEFAFIVQPLKLKGGTGSSIAPMAVR
jgi:kynurenine formamidase